MKLGDVLQRVLLPLCRGVCQQPAVALRSQFQWHEPLRPESYHAAPQEAQELLTIPLDSDSTAPLKKNGQTE